MIMVHLPWRVQHKARRSWGREIQISCGSHWTSATPYFVASVHLPDNTKNKEADEVVRQLFLDIAAIPDGAHVIIMGDWNFDPFRVKGKNKDAFKTMMTHPRMALLQRSDPLDCTRPAANTHIDNIFISKSVVPKTSSKIFYIHTPPHERTPSDHLIMGLKSMGLGRTGGLRTASLQFDMDPLRDSAGHAYTHSLDVLAGRWCLWAEGLGAVMGSPRASPRQETALLFAGLKLTIYSASYQTLPTKRMRERATNAGTLLTKFATGDSRKELWEVVS